MNKLPIELGAKGCQVLMMLECNPELNKSQVARLLRMTRSEVREAISRIERLDANSHTYSHLSSHSNSHSSSHHNELICNELQHTSSQCNSHSSSHPNSHSNSHLDDEELENRVNELKISELDVEDERKVVESPGPPPPSLLTTSLLPPIIPLVDDNKENTLISKDIVQKKGSKPKYGSDLTGMDEEEREYIATMKKRFPFIMRMDQPLTLTEFRKLKQNWSPQHITNTIESLNNFKGITKYRSAYKTLLNWCKNG